MAATNRYSAIIRDVTSPSLIQKTKTVLSKISAKSPANNLRQSDFTHVLNIYLSRFFII